jgi:hypothetical protein
VSEHRPPWKNLAPALSQIASEVKETGVGGRALVDQLTAYVRNTLDELGVSVTDENAVYVAITVAAFMVQMTRNAQRNGQAEPSTVYAVARIAQAFVAALIDYVPAEVRP